MSWLRRGSRPLAAFLLLVFLLGLAPPSLLAEPASASVPRAKLFGHVRYSGTGWGLLTPLVFATSRVVEAVSMEGASREEKLDHATRWAKNPRFWGAVAGDVVAVTVAQRLVSLMPGGAFVKGVLVCFAGFGMFEGIYGGFDQVDWGTLAFQSVVITAVEMLVAGLGLPFGGFLPFLAAFAAAMLLDVFDGYGGEEFDEAYMDQDEEPGARVDPGGTSASEENPSAPGSSGSAEAYRKLLQRMQENDRGQVLEAYRDYRGDSTPGERVAR